MHRNSDQRCLLTMETILYGVLKHRINNKSYRSLRYVHKKWKQYTSSTHKVTHLYNNNNTVHPCLRLDKCCIPGVDVNILGVDMHLHSCVCFVLHQLHRFEWPIGEQTSQWSGGQPTSTLGTYSACERRCQGTSAYFLSIVLEDLSLVTMHM